MSGYNVELLRRAFEAVNAHDLEAYVALFAPDVEAVSVGTVPGGAVYHGQDGIRSYVRDIDDAWDSWRVEPEVFFDLGDQLLAFYVYSGRGRHSGAEVAMPLALVVRVRDGLIVHFQALGRADALEALGVTEDELEPIAP